MKSKKILSLIGLCASVSFLGASKINSLAMNSMNKVQKSENEMDVNGAAKELEKFAEELFKSKLLKKIQFEFEYKEGTLYVKAQSKQKLLWLINNEPLSELVKNVLRDCTPFESVNWEKCAEKILVNYVNYLGSKKIMGKSLLSNSLATALDILKSDKLYKSTLENIVKNNKMGDKLKGIVAESIPSR